MEGLEKKSLATEKKLFSLRTLYPGRRGRNGKANTSAGVALLWSAGDPPKGRTIVPHGKAAANSSHRPEKVEG